MRGRKPTYYIEKKKLNWKTVGWLFIVLIYATMYETTTLIYFRVPFLVFFVFLFIVFIESVEERGFTRIEKQPVKSNRVKEC